MDNQLAKQDSAEQQIKQYNRIIAFATAVIFLGATFYHFVEKLTWIDSIYFTVITLATVGYGDITPHTAIGKIFTIFYVITGVAIFVALARAIIEKARTKRQQNQNKKG